LHVHARVNPRERWQSLQSHLSAARGALAAGDTVTALEHIEAALVIDPEFLAARMLRDRVMSPEPTPAATSSVLRTDAADVRVSTAAQPVQAVAPLVDISPEKLTSFEERVMQRVRDREATAARSAVARRQWVRLGVQLAAAAVFLTAVSSTALYEPHFLKSRSVAMSARLVDLETPAPLGIVDSPDRAAPATPEQLLMRPAPEAIAVTAMVAAPPEPVRESPPPAPQPQQPPPQPATQQQVVSQPAPRPVQLPPSRPAPDVAVASNVVLSSTPAVVPALLVSTVDDRSLVDQTLQRYRRAYNRLDAQSAQAVYPAVNAGALARAFDSLESQSLSFDSCDMELQGRSATVTCHGTSRYVPKIGNHIPRIEPRIWNFTLRKDDGDWKIENARAGGGR